MLLFRLSQAFSPSGKSTRIRISPSSASLATRYVPHRPTDILQLPHRVHHQFGGQEPGNDENIAEFCTLNHGVTFPLTKKTDVNGDNTNEVFKWLKSQKAGLLGLTRIKVSNRAFMQGELAADGCSMCQWNFEKFLVDKEGKVVGRWASTTTPEAIDAEIAKLL